MSRAAFSFAAVFVLSIAGAQATQQGQGALRNWKVMDICAKQAQAAYPEYSSESNAKRDARLKDCLNVNGLPPRQPLAQPESR